MLLTGYAYFIPRPRVFADLFRPHLIEEERPYHIVKTVTLPAIDYENFITDMLVDRAFRPSASRQAIAFWSAAVLPPTAFLLFPSIAVLSAPRRTIASLDEGGYSTPRQMRILLILTTPGPCHAEQKRLYYR